MAATIDIQADLAARAAEIATCLACKRPLEGRAACEGCGRDYPERDGILHAIGPLEGTNRIAAAFYDGPNWVRFRPWEELFLWFQGPGIARARRQFLRHLPQSPKAKVLEVGIGDGANVPLLPASWDVYGVDIARTRLKTCLGKFPKLAGRLVWAEGEALPFGDHEFDAVFTVGGFNYFRDHAAAMREMRRVTRPGGTVIVTDELANLYRLGLGHVLGIEALDRWGLQCMGLEPEFVSMVLDHRVDMDALARSEWPRHRRYPIWNRLGYCLVDLNL